jgi:hypothetical protein
MSTANRRMTNGVNAQKRSTENDAGTGPATPRSPSHSAKEIDEAIDEGDAAASDIETLFRRMIAGARLLPRRERAQARRAAHEWRRIALKELREKRMHDRHARHMLRQLKRIRPSGFDYR